MVDIKKKVPQPIPFEQASQADIPFHIHIQPPEQTKLTVVNIKGVEELTIIHKRTYNFSHDRPSVPADEQIPLDEQGIRYDDDKMTPDTQLFSYKSLPEIIGVKDGTDLVVQASAQSVHPIESMTVAVQVGDYRHAADVIGRRFCDYVKGRLVFTPPEPFEEMELRYENAYGGRDLCFEETLLKEISKNAAPDDIRRVKPVAEAYLKDSPPLVYPRNCYGKGYVIEGNRKFIEGRELPNLERVDDRLTTERLIVDNPLTWNKQPLPVGFDYFDAQSFPRSAMIGLPPAIALNQEPVKEVTLSLIPKDYCRGNVFSTPISELQNLIHPLASRCASLGLWLPFLRGNEKIQLIGMNKRKPEYIVQLPGERPIFTLNCPHVDSSHADSQLMLVCIDLHQQSLNLIWSARTVLTKPMIQNQLDELLPTIIIDMHRI